MSLLRWLMYGSGEKAQDQPKPAANDSHIDDTLAHAKEGYKNAQEIIKFVDTKTAVVTGLSTLLGGSLVGITKWSLESEKHTHATLGELAVYYPDTVKWLYACIALSLIGGMICIAAAVWSVIARPDPRRLENKFTVLFPLYKQREAREACRVFETKLRGMTKDEILAEYKDQLRVVGMILGKKLKHIRVACIALIAQLLFFVLAGALFVFMYVSSGSAFLNERIASQAGRVGPNLTLYVRF